MLTEIPSSSGKNNRLTIYEFVLPDGNTRKFEIPVDLVTLTYSPPETDNHPDWTHLEFKQCRNCPLEKSSNPLCPVARNLAPLIEWSDGLDAYSEVHVRVIDPQRTVSTNTSMQQGISSILGLVIATSPCPHTSFLRPMAHFHLPLAGHEETIYRSTSMYLLTQYYIHHDGRKADFSLDGLTRKYAEMQQVNASIASRLRAASLEDTAISALALLDLYAKDVPVSIEESLEDIRYIFEHRNQA